MSYEDVKCWPRTLGSYIAFIPFFDKNTITIKKEGRIYCIVISLAIVSLILYELYREVTLTESYKLRLLASTMQLVSTSRVIIGEAWTDFMRVFLQTERELKKFDFNQSSYRRKIYRMNCLYFVLCILDVIYFIFDYDYMEARIINKVQDFYKATLSTYIVCVIITIKRKFEVINYLTFHPTALTLSTKRRIQVIRRLYMMMNKEIKLFNKVFGFQLLAMIPYFENATISMKKWHRIYCLVFLPITFISVLYFVYMMIAVDLSFKFRAMLAFIHFISTLKVILGSHDSYRRQIQRVNKVLFLLYMIDVFCIFYHGEDLESSLTNKLQDLYKMTTSAYIICVILTIKRKQEVINYLTFHPTALSLNFRSRCQVIRRLYMKLNKEIKLFNGVFGLHLLLMTFYAFCVPVILTQYRSKIELRVGPLTIMFYCGTAYSDSRKIICICNKLQQNIVLLEKEQKEMDKLLIQVSTIKPEISAAGFFKMRKSTILSFFNISMTYIIVLSQFCNKGAPCI
nr:unnamed protein product [Callosobruchus chinensis]